MGFCALKLCEISREWADELRRAFLRIECDSEVKKIGLKLIELYTQKRDKKRDKFISAAYR